VKRSIPALALLALAVKPAAAATPDILVWASGMPDAAAVTVIKVHCPDLTGSATVDFLNWTTPVGSFTAPAYPTSTGPQGQLSACPDSGFGTPIF
jgi:hypothetical protein